MTIAVRLNFQQTGVNRIYSTEYRSFIEQVFVQALQIASKQGAVLVAQMTKGGLGQGVSNPTRLAGRLEWYRVDSPHCFTSEATETDKAAVRSLWDHVRQQSQSGDYKLIVLDEISVAVDLGIIDLEEVLDWLREKPAELDVHLTGQDMRLFAEMADEVTYIHRRNR